MDLRRTYPFRLQLLLPRMLSILPKVALSLSLPHCSINLVNRHKVPYGNAADAGFKIPQLLSVPLPLSNRVLLHLRMLQVTC